MAKEYIQQKSYWQDEDGNEHDNISEEGYKENGVKCGEWKYYYLRESKILLTDQIGVELIYPSTGMVQKLTGVGEMDTDTVFKLISKCIEQIWDKDEVYNAVDYSQKELDSFLESLTSEQFGKIRTFFEAIPKLQHEITWTCQHCSKTTKMMLEGLQSFFG